MGAIELKAVEKWFDELQVIKGVDLKIEDGEFVVFVGPSGCGKSTLLRIISGLEEASRGDILIDGKSVVSAPPSQRGLAMVFQSYALYPHMSVRENVGFGLKTAGKPKSEIQEKVDYAASILKLDDYLDRRPKALSGGQRQRVAIGRAIVREPSAFLFDEPLSNLDAALRVEMRFEIAKLHQNLGSTMIYVTHDQVEAMTLADKIVVLSAGKIEQVGSPRELYEHPANLFVAQFIGSPKMNIIPCTTVAENFKIDGHGTGSFPQHTTGRKAVKLGIRPEHIQLGDPSYAHMRGTVDVVEYLGADTYLYVTPEGHDTLIVRVAGTETVKVGDDVALIFEKDFVCFFDEDGQAIR